MAVRDLAERYAMQYPPPKVKNHLYVIRRACKQLEERGEIDLVLEDRKLIAQKHTESPPWEAVTGKLDEHFYKKNLAAQKKRGKS